MIQTPYRETHDVKRNYNGNESFKLSVLESQELLASRKRRNPCALCVGISEIASRSIYTIYQHRLIEHRVRVGLADSQKLTNKLLNPHEEVQAEKVLKNMMKYLESNTLKRLVHRLRTRVSTGEVP